MSCVNQGKGTAAKKRTDTHGKEGGRGDSTHIRTNLTTDTKKQKRKFPKVASVSKKYRKIKKRKRKQIPGIKNTPNDNDEGLTVLPSQHNKKQKSAQAP